MLIILQHNAAHLGIATGYCLAESATINLKKGISKTVLLSAVAAVISTVMAELLGGAIALNMLFKIPVRIGAIIILVIVLWMLFANSYTRLEKWIIGFVSIIGLSFIFELSKVSINWNEAVRGWVTPSFPADSMPVIMSVLGAVVMPHNMFLHSEVIQSRQWNLKDEKIMHRQLKYEYLDTIFSMLVGWAINSAMILIDATTFYKNGINVTELSQAQEMLKPILGRAASVIFAMALLFSGISSSVTAGMAGGSIFAGMYKEPYDIKDSHTRFGVAFSLVAAALAVFFISDPFKGLVYSQMLLSIQLPVTVFLQIYLTSSKKVMGKFANTRTDTIAQWTVGIIVTVLNILLLTDFVKSVLF
jgi:manganese transport protein